MFYPDAYFKSVEEITIEFLKKHKIKAVILDVDNTLIDIEENLHEDKIQWAKNMRGQGIKLYILSNTNKKEKIEKVANKLNLEYQCFAKKPFKRGFKKVANILNEKPERIATVGDQIFTDIIGGNRCGMFSILVEPVEKKDYWYTAWKRPLENKIKKRFLINQTKEKKDVH